MISSGLAHAIPRCQKSKSFVYHLENVFRENPETFVEKFFKASFIRFSAKRITTTDYFVTPFEFSDSNTLLPFIEDKDWWSNEETNSNDKSIVFVNPNGFKKKELLALRDVCQKYNKTVLLEYVPSFLEGENFDSVDHPCSGELLPIFHKSSCYVQATESSFPFRALEANLSGVPVISKFSDLNSSVLLSEDCVFLKDWKDFENALKSATQISISSESDKVIRKRFSSTIFKAKFIKALHNAQINFSIR